ncbi:MAG TPA: TonB-dependent receptor [Hyphomonadaceae bacterium]|nr:TonB-dependent receptor [Hyphomonadaceae bacterium]
MVGNAFLAATASAQSTASSALDAAEVVVVTGSVGPADIGGITEQTVAKNRTTVTQDYIETQTAGQTILQTLSIVTPGLNFTNNDPYGSSGGNIRLHGFDGNRIALTFDGMPLNDSGNYATFTNQLVDSELISSAQVNTGSTDVDSPTAASTGGTIGLSSRMPDDEFGGWVQASQGDFNYHRFMGLIDSGEVGPWGTKGWLAASYQEYDKFKGEGDLHKAQYNGKIYQPIGEGNDFISVAFHWNANRNNAYFGPNLRTRTITGATNTPAQYVSDPRGYEFDFNTNYTPIATTTRAGFTGDIDQDPSANSNYWKLRINPSDTGNIRVQSRFDFGDNLTLTIDPSFQYVMANGGTQNLLVWESCNGSGGSGTTNPTSSLAGNNTCPALTRQLLGNSPVTTTNGRDLNGDGDINDLVRVMNPSNTNTRRVGLLGSLIWKFADDQLFRVAYTYDRAKHRQTGEFGYINPGFNSYASPFGGKDGWGQKILTADGQSFMRNRDRYSEAMLNQVSAEYRGKFLDDKLTVSIGARAPFFERELNQYCYSQNGSTFVRCTTETPNATLSNGNVTFAGVFAGNTAGAALTEFVAPFQRTLKFDDLLPNVGVSYFFGDSQVYGNYTESTSLPRTDNLYQPVRVGTAPQDFKLSNVEPETSTTFEGGYRYSKGDIIASVSAWNTNFKNRIVNSFDQDLNISIDRNVGSVQQWGVDGSIGWSPVEELTLYGTVSYNDSEVQDNLILNGSATGTVFIKGKKIVETPEWAWSSRLEFRPTEFLTFGGQLKYVGERFATDTNDLVVDAYNVVDLDARWDLEQFGFKGSSVSANVINLFDKDYIGSISSQTSSTVGTLGFGTPFGNVGAPRTYTVTLRYGF